MEKNKHYRIGFKNYEILSGHVEYSITLICENDNKINVEFKDRYSNLKDLHEAMRKEANSINFPKFPPKKLFGNLDEKFLNERKIKLQHYFSTILGSKDFSQLPSLNKWIEGLINNFNKANKENLKGDGKQTNSNDGNLQKNIKSQQGINSSNTGLCDSGSSLINKSQKGNIFYL